MTGRDASAQVDPSTLQAWAYLSRVAEPGSLAVVDFVERFGPVDGARLIRAGDVPAEVGSATEARRDDAAGAADLDAGHRQGLRLLVPESTDWPHFAMAGLYQAQQRRLDEWRCGARATRYGGEPTVPLGLWVAGPLPVSDLAIRSVAVVGARAATAYGEHCAAEFGYGLAARDVTVVSGGAFGIDAGAHRGALAAEGGTVLVSAGGLDRPYPSAHRNLFDRVREQGLLVSESPPGAAPHRPRFLSRNRIIAALSTGTVVVEAATRSGALNTAAHCLLIGRPLMAVPGPVTSAMSTGCHTLIRQDRAPARLVTSVPEIMEVIGRVGEVPYAGGGRTGAAGGADRGNRLASVDEAVPDGGQVAAPGPGAEANGGGHCGPAYDDLEPDAQRVFDGLPARGWATEDQLSARSGAPLLQVRRALPMLRLAGLVESGPAGHRLRRRSGRSG